ncbi:transmembrane protein, putative (macronuclear) [Tetrahymena thermophila SB210]|uniref:Transmembrane protein, putative n=1 Tax=Tetrahymena thermophila (strain SB210) TaxID=312017 RepID=W7XAX7_TETTS|nr:transmembrane protein, putative [Tetrahymena thermophila SB210]EWS73578.1 transmembrane protein, putative [Tetrahymena thermophila SB210]|eukprot:XP_012653901.1 transmembrane protein, putative [Tetrahymena thermophila SB210]
MNISKNFIIFVFVAFCLFQQTFCSWECITMYSCTNKYQTAKQQHPDIIFECTKISKAGTHSFDETEFIQCLDDIGFKYSDIVSLEVCVIQKCQGIKELIKRKEYMYNNKSRNVLPQ